MSVYNHLNGDPIDDAVRRLLLMDYTEEMFEVIMSSLEDQRLLSPCALMNFVDSCLRHETS
jgi:hypothetical protein